MNKDNSKIVQATPIYSDYLPAIPGIKHIPEFLQFVQWFATPGQFRKPKYQKEFAGLIGVNQDTLTDWKRHPQFWPLVWQFLREWMQECTPDVIGGLYEKIVSAKGGASDVQLFLRLAEGELKTSENKKIN